MPSQRVTFFKDTKGNDFQKNKLHIPTDGSETNHVQILKNLLDQDKTLDVAHISKFEKRHHTVGGNAIRAAVLGGNDGLVSNFSLVMGVAGATNGEKGVLLAGMAGLLAGALSMALGLFLIGSAITLFTGKSMVWSGLRQVFFGLTAAAITYAIGHFIGVSLG